MSSADAAIDVLVPRKLVFSPVLQRGKTSVVVRSKLSCIYMCACGLPKEKFGLERFVTNGPLKMSASVGADTSYASSEVQKIPEDELAPDGP
jgi:hypothetical protein